MPYWVANGVGFSLEHGYRLLRTHDGPDVQPLLSRQAVQVLGSDQNFSSRKARELLGWEPRVDYPTGLEATARLAAERLPGLTHRAVAIGLSRRPPATGPGCSRSRGT